MQTDTDSTDVSKRHFLQAAGAAAAIGLATRVRAAASSDAWDVIVVGGGNAGLPTAIFAAQRGARVLIIEAAGQIGGTLFLSTGQMSAAGTKLQRARGITDTPQSHYDDIMRISDNSADPELVRLAVDHAAPVFDWLTDHGFAVLPGHPVTGTTHDPYSHARYAWGPEGGRSILNVLSAQLAPLLANGRVKILTQTKVTELLQQGDGTVTGVVAASASGDRQRYLAHQTVLTCGGYTNNPGMYERLEGAKTYSRATYPHSLGAGIELGLAAGGYVRGGDKHTPLFGAVAADSDYPAPMRALVRHFPPDRPPFEIYVNAAGKRFVREDIPSHTAYERGLGAQTEERCWVVFDDAILRAAPPLATSGINAFWPPENTAAAFENGTPMFFRAESVAALAAAAGIDAAGLASTVTDFNRGQASGQDSLGRKHMPMPIDKPPYYAIQLQSWNLTAYAGIAVNNRLQAIRGNGTVIRNLYIAGELLGMGQLMGRSICGGMAVTPALAFGRLLGREILSFPT
ncbi:MAG TPA: FAD-dependent oxidoreductase [Steroidobacteraceae bacterium]|nr:FAD-dependent oxidoreductase [Steroidobacteraceae bacterium]